MTQGKTEQKPKPDWTRDGIPMFALRLPHNEMLGTSHHSALHIGLHVASGFRISDTISAITLLRNGVFRVDFEHGDVMFFLNGHGEALKKEEIDD